MRRPIVACLGFALFAAGCAGKPDQREYPLQGQVLSVAGDRQQATIDHEAIKGFMAAMTMPYKMRDAKQLEGVAPGDLINATLIVTANDAYVTDLKKVGEAPLPKAPAEAATPAASSGFELLKSGDEVPNSPFVDQNARPRRFGSFRGIPLLVTFIYTKCPIPTFCPMMDRHFATIQQKAKDDPSVKGTFHMLSVSFDPVTDSPAVLREHAKTLGADLKTWTFLTGDRDEIDKFASRFGVSVARSSTDPRDITHNLRTAIVDANGRLVKVYVGNEWTPDQAIKDLALVVKGS